MGDLRRTLADIRVVEVNCAGRPFMLQAKRRALLQYMRDHVARWTRPAKERHIELE